MRIKIYSFIVFLLIAVGHFRVWAQKVTITIELSGNDSKSLSITKAPLKYNKDFAYSFTLDDGLTSAYKVAYPLLNGGKISGSYIDGWKSDQGGDGSISPGLFYTDGCGKAIPFRAAVAVNTQKFKSDADTLRSFLTWKEIATMYRSGWDVLNHGYGHATEDGTNYSKEVQQNTDSVAKNTNIHMTQFVVPGGKGVPNYHLLYIDAANKNGYKVVYTYSELGPLLNVDAAVPLNNVVINRAFITNSDAEKAFYRNKDNIMKSVNDMAAESQNGKHYWLHEFTHGVGNTNLWGISLPFDLLKYYMTSLAAAYGKNGKDNMWMAPAQEVTEYLAYRDQSKLSFKRAGTQVVITIDADKVPKYLRRNALTLLINADFKVINVSEGYVYSSNGTGNNKIITIEKRDQ